MTDQRTYIAIDLKSFYASVECQQRGIDPLLSNLVVADTSRTDKTICLAVSPALKAYGIPGRGRLYEVIRKVREINQARREAIRYQPFRGASINAKELAEDPYLELSYIAAVPRMALYMEYSSRVYSVYLRYIAPEDIHVYSIDEVFMDVTSYLKTYGLSAHELAIRMIREVLALTGITATAGIGPNMYLAKVAMDIVAKKMPADEDGVRIAELSEMDYRRYLWTHKPLRDFWRVGRGIGAKLEANGMYTMGDVARCAVENEELLYKLFGVNAEFLIDHAFGYEDTLISEIKDYKPASNSIGSGQVLMSPYSNEKAKIIVREMTDALVLNLVDHQLVSDAFVLSISYDRSSLADGDYSGELKKDYYGRVAPKGVHGTAHMPRRTSSSKMVIDGVLKLYEKITDPSLLIRRINITACNVVPESEAKKMVEFNQISLFDDHAKAEAVNEKLEEDLKKEHNVQQAILKIQKKYGKNAVLKGVSLEEGATGRERNEQIGGHKA
ncbi:MAG: DNA methylase [Erysipelotrichaceae bacterium]|nr:DNA methylase [Erysipelotrichaceae bacterium]